MSKKSQEFDEVFNRNFKFVSSQVINYIEGFHLATVDDDFTKIISNHKKLSLDVEEYVFNKLDLSSKYDLRWYYGSLWLDRKEVYRIAEEVSCRHLTKLQYKFPLRDHQSNPTLIEPYFNELFNLVNIRDDDKNRFTASLSSIMTQIIRDILEVESDRTRFALVLYGSQGCGKTTFLTTLCRVAQGEDVNLQKSDFYSNFDSEEILKPVFRVEDLNYKFRDVVDKIKSIVTNIGMTTINVKYKPEQRVVVRTTALMDTNHDFINIIKTDGEQRRFCIFELGESTKVKHFEKKLNECLTKIFKIHTTEYLYDIYKISERNLELTDVNKEFMEQLEKRFYEKSHRKEYSEDADKNDPTYDTGDKTYLPSVEIYRECIYKTRELKDMLKHELTVYDPNNTFLSDELLMKIRNRFFSKDFSSRDKNPIYKIKKIDKNSDGTLTICGKRGVCGVSEKSLSGEKTETETFLLNTANTANTANLKELIPNLTKTENPYEITYEDFLIFYRDVYIFDYILTPQKFLFVDEEEEQVQSAEPVEPKEKLSIDDFVPSEFSTLYYSDTLEGRYTTTFPEYIDLVDDDLKLFCMAVQRVNTGSLFTDDIAKNENFLQTNLLLVDIDSHSGEDLSNIDDVGKLGLEYYRVKSRGGSGYHFYFPLSHIIDNEKFFRLVYTVLINKLESVNVRPDYACRNPSRKFFGTTYIKSATYHRGNKFDVLEALGEEYELIEGKNGLEKGEFIKMREIAVRKIGNKNTGDFEVSENNELTDKYFNGFTNEGKVVEDLPHMINYILTLKENDKEFFSYSQNKHFEIDFVIDKIKETVSYDESHVRFIDTIIENRGNQ